MERDFHRLDMAKAQLFGAIDGITSASHDRKDLARCWQWCDDLRLDLIVRQGRLNNALRLMRERERAAEEQRAKRDKGP